MFGGSFWKAWKSYRDVPGIATDWTILVSEGKTALFTTSMTAGCESARAYMLTGVLVTSSHYRYVAGFAGGVIIRQQNSLPKTNSANKATAIVQQRWNIRGEMSS